MGGSFWKFMKAYYAHRKCVGVAICHCTTSHGYRKQSSVWHWLMRIGSLFLYRPPTLWGFVYFREACWEINDVTKRPGLVNFVSEGAFRHLSCLSFSSFFLMTQIRGFVELTMSETNYYSQQERGLWLECFCIYFLFSWRNRYSSKFLDTNCFYRSKKCWNWGETVVVRRCRMHI
jgi:hypothetical protein